MEWTKKILQNDEVLKLIAAVGAFILGIVLICTSFCIWLTVGVPICILMFILGLVVGILGLIPLIRAWLEWQDIEID